MTTEKIKKINQLYRQKKDLEKIITFFTSINAHDTANLYLKKLDKINKEIEYLKKHI